MKLKSKLRPVFKGTKFFLLACSALVGLAGCSASKNAPPAMISDVLVDEPLPPEKKPALTIHTPADPGPDDLAIIYESSRLRLGELEQDAMLVIPRPKKNAFDSNEEPPIDAEGVRTRGWESADHALGLLLTAKGRVLLAVYSIENTTQNEVNAMVAEHERVFGASEAVLGETCEYHFWAKGQSKLMICAAKDSRKKLSVSVAVGQFEIMDALGMAADQANKDKLTAAKMLKRMQARSAEQKSEK